MTNALSIPGWKNEAELNIAAKLVKKCKPYSIIVEIGAAAGRVTWVLSENATTNSIVYAIDLWNGEHIFAGRGYLLNPTKTNTFEYFLQFLHERIDINVKPIQADSLTIKWYKEIDLIILDPDAGFGKTNLCDHLEKWYPYVKKDGIVMGYNSSRSDVIDQVVSFSEKHNLILELDYLIWKFKK